MLISIDIVKAYLKNDCWSELCQFAEENADYKGEIELDDGEGNMVPVPVIPSSVDCFNVSIDTCIARFKENETVVNGECEIDFTYEYQILDGDKDRCWYETVGEESESVSANYEIAVARDSYSNKWQWTLVDLR